MIQAVILAGGLGTRMRPFTETVPKPLLPVLGRPFLEHQLQLLQTNGLRRFVLLVGYLGRRIEDHFREHPLPGDVEMLYSYEPEPLGTGGALKNASHLLDYEFLVLNGDTLLDIDYAALVTQFRAQRAHLTVAAYRNLAQTVPSNLDVAPDGLVLAYSKLQPTGEFVDAGVQAVRKSVLDSISPGEKCSFEQEVFPKLIARGQLTAWPTSTPFFDMGTPAGMRALEAHLNR